MLLYVRRRRRRKCWPGTRSEGSYCVAVPGAGQGCARPPSTRVVGVPSGSCGAGDKGEEGSGTRVPAVMRCELAPGQGWPHARAVFPARRTIHQSRQNATWERTLLSQKRCFSPLYNTQDMFLFPFPPSFMSFLLAMPCCMRDLSSLTRDRTHAPLCWGHGVLTTGSPGKSHKRHASNIKYML